MRVRVKVCGVTTPEDAVAAADAGADFLGLNFHPPSPRFLDLGRARAVADAVRGRATLVGVFVDRPAAEVARTADAVGLDLVQLHGDETPAAVRPLAARAIKALRVAGDVDPAALAPWSGVWGVLLDARHPTLHGGSGRRWNVASLARLAARPERLFVAGGIDPAGVGELVRSVRPWAVDVCSGVESSPGRKDPRLLARLFQEIRDVETTTTTAA